MSVDIVGNDIKHPEFNELQRTTYGYAQAVILAASEQKLIDLINIHRILDFGAGLGGPTAGVMDTTSEYNPHIDVIEKDEIWVNILRQTGLIPDENIIHQDGIAYLKNLTQNGILPYDLITAFGFDPDGTGRIFRQLASAASSALNPTGNILMTSDNGTINVIIKACEESEAPYYFIPEVKEDRKYIRPSAVIVPQSSCIKIKPSNIPLDLF